MPKPKTIEKESVIQFDRMPERERLFEAMARVFHDAAVSYGFEKIHTAAVEDARTLAPVIKSGLMEERAPVLCKTSAGIDIMLRVSGALGILRAYAVQKMNDLPHPLKFSFEGETFFFSNNRGGIRSLNEWGMVMIGEEGPIAEAEIIQVIWKSLAKLGLEAAAIELRVNAIGCIECRPSFRSAFGAYFRPKVHRLCKNCKRHLKRSPTKILNCKEETCRMLATNTPQVLDFLCEMCKKHLRGVLEFLDEIRISYILDSKFFNDGAPYNTLLFQFILHTMLAPAPLSAPVAPVLAQPGEVPAEIAPAASIEPQPAPAPIKESWILGEGGRISRAGEIVVGRRLDAACGVVRMDELAELFTRKKVVLGHEEPRVFLAQLGDLAKRRSLGLIEALREGGILLRESLGRDSVKSQLKVAERIGAEIALILGQKEALDQTIIVREIQSGIQETISQDKLIEFLKRKLKK